jgi:hypothetical protein
MAYAALATTSEVVDNIRAPAASAVYGVFCFSKLLFESATGLCMVDKLYFLLFTIISDDFLLFRFDEIESCGHGVGYCPNLCLCELLLRHVDDVFSGDLWG